MKKKEQPEDVKAVVDLLPEDLQARIDWKYGRAYLQDRDKRNVLHIIAENASTWNGGWCLYVRPSSIAGYKNKHWRQLKDKTFSYQKVADHVVKLEKLYTARESRRTAGRSIAERRIEVLTKAFQKDSLLSQFNLNIKAKVQDDTESGTVQINVSCKCPCGNDDDLYHRGTCALDNPDGPVETYQGYGHTVPMLFNGKTFSGDLQIRNISVEQFTALMAVLRFDQLNLLEMIPLAGDSILGPSIMAMMEEEEADADGSGQAA